jgi:type I restriction enzyme, S subunit
MNTARVAPIGSFCQTGSGTTPPRSAKDKYYGGSIPWVKSGELRETDVENTEETVTELALKETPLKLIPPGSLLVAMYGATVGRTGILRTQATTNQAICHIIPDENIADTRYLFHALQYLQPTLVRRGVGGAQPNISQEIIRSIEVLLPRLREQRRIAAILDQTDDLRRNRQKALERLNLLRQSIFLEVFGDPATNPKGWDKSTVGCALATGLLQEIQDGNHGERHATPAARNEPCRNLRSCKPSFPRFSGTLRAPRRWRTPTRGARPFTAGWHWRLPSAGSTGMTAR